MSIFAANAYKTYIKTRIAEAEQARGYHGRLAEAAGCKSSYLSQVLGGKAHLTPDQAAGLCDFWGLSEAEADYFLDLLHLARAGTPALRQRLERQLRAARERQASLAARFQSARTIDAPDSLMTYYSAWHIAAAHMLVGIPAFQTTAQIAARLAIPVAMAQQALLVLQEIKLIRANGSTWERAPVDLHLPQDSPMASVAHANWRRRAEVKYAEAKDNGLFYTGIHSLASSDLPKVRQILLEALAKARQVITASGEEDVVCITCDLFRV